MQRTIGVTCALLASAAVLLVGCASMQTTEWTGHKIDEVIKEFGKPNSTTPAGDGRTMYVWNREAEFTSGSWSGTNVAPTTHKRLTVWTFWVNQERTIVTWNRQEGQVY